MSKIYRILSLCLALTLLFSSLASAESGTISWKKSDYPVANDLNGIAVNDRNVYVAVGDDRTMMSSLDGQSWQEQAAPRNGDLKAVIASGSRFVAVGSNGTVLTSVNGTSWTQGTVALDLKLSDLYDNETKKFYKSKGLDISQKYQLKDLDLFDVIWDGTKFVAFGQLNDPYSYKHYFTLTSKEAQSWNIHIPIPKGTYIMSTANKGGIVWTGRTYVAVYDRYVFTSDNLRQWKVFQPNIKGMLEKVAYHGGTLIAIGWDGLASSSKNQKARLTGIVYRSTDTVHWQEVKIDNELGTVSVDWAKKNYDYNGFTYLPLQSVLWDGTRFVVGARNGVFLSSNDGQRWSVENPDAVAKSGFAPFSYVRRSGELADIKGIVYTGNQYIAVGNNGTIKTSPDGKEWTVTIEKQNAKIGKVLYDNGRYVAYGSEGTLLESKDGMHWDKTTLEGIAAGDQYSSAVVKDHRFLLIGLDLTKYKSVVFISDQYGEWKPVTVHDGPMNFTEAAVEGNFFKITSANQMATSRDGVDWTVKDMKTVQNTLAASNGSVTVAGMPYQNDSRAVMQISKDGGKKWMKYTLQNGTYKGDIALNDIVWDGKRFVTFGESYTDSYILVSTNGLDWKSTKLKFDMSAMASNGTYIVTVGRDGSMYRSRDGLKWTLIGSLTSHHLNDIIWDGQRFIAGGDGGVILVGQP